MVRRGPDGFDDVPLRLHFDPEPTLLANALACESDVFVDRYRLDADALREYWSPYAESSSFLCLSDQDGTVHAVARVVFPGPAGLITLVDAAEDPWHVDAEESLARTGLDPARTCDIATIAVRSSGRPRGVLQAAVLYHGLIQITRANGMQGILAILDQRVRRTMAQLGILMHALPGTTTVPYWGSPASTPVWADVDELISTQRRRYPDAYRLVTLGSGLGDVQVPSLDGFRRRGPVLASDGSVLPSPPAISVPAISVPAIPVPAQAATIDVRRAASADEELLSAQGSAR